MVDNTICDPLTPVIGALGRYARRADNVNIRIYHLSPDEIEDRIERGRIDIGIIPLHERRPGLIYVPLYTERNLLYCGSGHPCFHTDKRNGAGNLDLSSLRHVLHGYKHTPLEQASNFGFTRDATAFSVEGIAMMILTGQFLGFLPQCYAQRWVDCGEMKAIDTDRYFFNAEIVAAYQRGSDGNAVVKGLLDELMATLPHEEAAGRLENSGAQSS